MHGCARVHGALTGREKLPFLVDALRGSMLPVPEAIAICDVDLVVLAVRGLLWWVIASRPYAGLVR